MRTATLLALLLLVPLSGCIRRPPPPVLRYALEPAVSVPRVEATDRALGVRPLEAAMPYRLKVIFRDGLEIGEYRDVEWAELPRDIVTRALLDTVAATGRFADVGSAPDVRRPNLLLLGELRRFDEVRTDGAWEAHVVVRLEVREALGPGVLWSEVLSAQVPLARNEVSALPDAMTRAVEDIVGRAAAAIAAL